MFRIGYKKRLSEQIKGKRSEQVGKCGFLNEKGIVPYEISNSAVPAFESRHNTAYWDGCDYYAIGAGAHGFLNSVRFGHDEDVDSYISSAVKINKDEVNALLGTEGEKHDHIEGFIYFEERLTLNDRMREYPFLKLRTAKGIDTAEFKQRFAKDFEEVYAEELNSNIEKGYLKSEGQRISLTKSGLDFANLVMEDFL